MKEENRTGRFRSVVNRIVFLPLMVMGAFAVLAVITCFFVVANVEKEVHQSNMNSIRILENDITYQMSMMDQTIWDFWSNNEDHQLLAAYKNHAERSSYMITEMEVLNWLNNYSRLHQQFQGMMLYYSNIDTFLFGGTVNYEMHEFLRNNVKEHYSDFTKWSILELNDQYYFIKIYKWNGILAAAWMPVNDIESDFKINDGSYIGEVYFFDRDMHNTLNNYETNIAFYEQIDFEKYLNNGSQRISNVTTESDSDIKMGILISNKAILDAVPLSVKIIVILLIITFVSVPIIIHWLQHKIAQPIRAMNDAMTMIGEGNMDYRIDPTRNDKVYDELDRLIEQFNTMMDDLNELEFNLYMSKIKEQQTELKYISQQIRPHFILNALNIIYTYEESEFDLVKKMVLYLTDYFRYIVNLRADMIEVEKELYHIQNYLNIQKERYMDSFDFTIDWEIEIADAQIPPLILQTFVENCIKYALGGREKHYIYVGASMADGRLYILIKDTGKGYPDETLEKIRCFIEMREHQDGLGIGIENAIERLDILYKEPYQIKFSNAPTGGAVVELYLPIIRTEEGR